MKIFKFFLLITVLGNVLQNNLIAQNDISLRMGAGYTDENGAYISFNSGISFLASLEISPSFSYANSIFADKSVSTDNIAPSNYYPEPSNEIIVDKGFTFTSIDINLIFKPFELFNNKAKLNHEFYLGIGYGYKKKIAATTLYKIYGANKELDYIYFSSFSDFSPNFLIGYNYKIKQRIIMGVTSEIKWFQGSMEILYFGFQTGIIL